MGARKILAPAINRLHDIFDFSPETLAKRPDQPQRALERMPDAARGIPAHVLRVAEPENLARMDSYAKAGDAVGARGWWNTEQLRQYFQGELGAEEGNKAFETFAGMVAATSTRAKPPQNTKMASHYYQRDRQGETIQVGDEIPDGYGHFVQENHQRNAATIQTLGQLDSKKNPKVASMQQNLLGNYEPLTADVHNSRALRLTTAGGKPVDVPEPQHYRFVEDLQKARAEGLGMLPAEYQANAWVGAGDKTGLGGDAKFRSAGQNPADPFLKVFEDRVGITADKMGLPKEQVLRRMIRGEIPLHTFVNPLAGGSLETNQAEATGPENARRPSTADDGYKGEPVSQAEVQAGLPALSAPPKDVYAKIKLPVDRDLRLEDLPPGFAVTDGGVVDPQGKLAQFQNPGIGDLASYLASYMQPAGPVGAAAKAIAGAAHTGSATMGVGPALGGRLKQLERVIPGKPDTVRIPGTGEVAAAPIKELEDAAAGYMAKVGRPGAHQIDEFPAFNEDKARRIAEAYEAMQHAPNDPAVRRAYDAMIEETMGQYRALKDLGLEFKANPPGHDPYAASPAMGYADLVKNGRLHFFPTEQGYGTLSGIDDNPLLRRVGTIGDLPNATANDAFRVVHDAFGHFGPGNPFFRHKGEDRAWYAHSQMYSPEATPAMTAETRGQNSWLNFGPYGESNRGAPSAQTVYAEQKAGIMPDWATIPAILAAAGVGGAAATGNEEPRF
jgi:hypothetical protein